MKDLTQDSISRNILAMAAPIAAGMVFQTLYFLVDLYFVAGLGDAAVAGVSAAGTLMFVIMALTQVLGVGAVALIAQAVGRKDQADANLVFNQSVLLALVCAVATLVGGYALTNTYVSAIAADAATHVAGTTYLYWFLPGLALGFAQVVMGSALRGTGIVKPTMAIQALTVLLNTLLAPVLIAGWGTGSPLGVAGAGLASIDVDRGRRRAAGDVFRAAREVRVVQERALASAARRLEAHARRWPAGRRRVRADVHLYGRDLLGHRATSARRRKRASASARESCSRSSCPRWPLRSRRDRSPGRISARGAPRACARRSRKA